MITKKRTVGREIIVSHNYKPTRLKNAVLWSEIAVNTVVILAFVLFTWLLLSIGGDNVEKYCAYHAGQHDINCLLTDNY